MGVLVQSLLIWLLVLALPAQGVAAASMAFCGPNHPGGGEVQAHQHAQGAHPHAAIEASTAHEHHAMATRADEPVDAAATAAGSTRAKPADTHKCSACASCCSAGALLNTVLTVPSPELAITVFSAVVATVDAFAADGPDRPPRSVPA